MSLIEIENKKKSDDASFWGLVVRIVVTIVLDAAAIWLITGLVNNEDFVLATALGIVTFIINIILLRNKTYPLRWMSIGIFFMCMFSIYPILFTVYVAFTNFGDGHLLDKEQAIAQIEKERYLPEGGTTYSWTAFRAETGEYALWLKDSQGVGYLAVPGQPLQQLSSGESPVGEFDDNGIPKEIAGYARLNAITLAASGAEDELRDILFGSETDGVKIASSQTAIL